MASQPLDDRVTYEPDYPANDMSHEERSRRQRVYEIHRAAHRRKYGLPGPHGVTKPLPDEELRGMARHQGAPKADEGAM